VTASEAIEDGHRGGVITLDIVVAPGLELCLRGCIRTNVLIIISLFPEMVSFNPRPASPYT
jgi:hypothetical protein